MTSEQINETRSRLTGNYNELNEESLIQLQKVHDFACKFGIGNDNRQHYYIDSEDGVWYSVDFGIYSNGFEIIIDGKTVILEGYCRNEDKKKESDRADSTEAETDNAETDNADADEIETRTADAEGLIEWIYDTLQRQFAFKPEEQSYSDFLRKFVSPNNRVGYILRPDFLETAQGQEPVEIKQHSEVTEEECEELQNISSVGIRGYLRRFATLNEYYELFAAGCKACGYDTEGLSDKEIFLKYGAGNRAQYLENLDENEKYGLASWAERIVGGSLSAAYITQKNETVPIDFRLMYDEVGSFIKIECNDIRYWQEVLRFYLAAKNICDCFWITNYEELKERVGKKGYIKLVPARYGADEILRETANVFFDAYYAMPKRYSSDLLPMIRQASWQSLPNTIPYDSFYRSKLNVDQHFIK